jgi:hypothetical protein
MTSYLETLEAIRAGREISPASELEAQIESLARKQAKLMYELAKRGAEALALYIALPTLAVFHEQLKIFRLPIGSNQSGKTTGAAVEIARCICNMDPYGKYPARGNKIFAVGLDERHLAEPMLEKLVQPGAFSCIKDEHTGVLRAVRWIGKMGDQEDPIRLDPYDEAYQEKWTESPPILSPRLCDPNKPSQLKYRDKGAGVPEILRIPSTDSEVVFRSSKAAPDQGTQKHGYWFDEHLENPQIFDEAMRGSMRRSAWFIWSATPQRLNHQLTDLRDRARGGDPDVMECHLLLKDNPYISEKRKRIFYESLTPEDREVRWYGRAASDVRQVYRDFDPMNLHGVDPFDIPDNWTIYMAVDPGTQHCGTLFAAVDPNEEHIYIYNGWDLMRGDAERWALKVSDTLNGRQVEAIIFDQQMGKQKVVGESKNRFERYSEALEQQGIEPRRKSGLPDMGGFFPGCNKVQTREDALISWMKPRAFGFGMGSPKLKIFRGVLPELEKQISNAMRVILPNGQAGKRQEKRNDKLQEDLLDCLEYFAGSEGLLTYQEPDPPGPKSDGGWGKYLEERFQRDSRKSVVF